MSEKGKAMGKCGENGGKQAKKATVGSQCPQADLIPNWSSAMLKSDFKYHLIPIHFLSFPSNFILISSLSHFSTIVSITLLQLSETKLFCFFFWEQRSLVWFKPGSLNKICAFVFGQVKRCPCKLPPCSWLQSSDGGFERTLVSMLISLTSGVDQQSIKSCRCSCLLQGSWTTRPLRISSISNYWRIQGRKTQHMVSKVETHGVQSSNTANMDWAGQCQPLILALVENPCILIGLKLLLSLLFVVLFSSTHASMLFQARHFQHTKQIHGFDGRTRSQRGWHSKVRSLLPNCQVLLLFD